MMTNFYKIRILPHRLTTVCEQNHKIIVNEVFPSNGTSNFTLRNLSYRKEAILMYYYDINEDDLDGLPSIVTPAMAADTLCVHVNTIYNLLRSGKMAGFRMGAAWRIRKKDRKRLTKQRTCQTRSPSERIIPCNGRVILRAVSKIHGHSEKIH